MGQKLYVGGLPYSVTEEQLQELFSAHGTVESARVIADKYTGQSRGFGFVDMSSPAEAQQAIKALHGSQLSGRTLVVNEARQPLVVPWLSLEDQGCTERAPLAFVFLNVDILPLYYFLPQSFHAWTPWHCRYPRPEDGQCCLAGAGHHLLRASPSSPTANVPPGVRPSVVPDA